MGKRNKTNGAVAFTVIIILTILTFFTVSACSLKQEKNGDGPRITQQNSPSEAKTEPKIAPGIKSEANRAPGRGKVSVTDHVAPHDTEPGLKPESGVRKRAETRKGQPLESDADAEQIPLPPKRKVKGIYVSGHAAGHHSKMAELIDLVENSKELNAMVIDVKNDFGKVTYDSDISMVNAIGADQPALIPSMEELLKQLKQKGIYTIARLVVFKDPYLAGKMPHFALQRKSGGVWQDAKGTAWVDPYHPEVRQYNLQVAREAARLGFDEIQFDYVRFPENGKKVDQEVSYHHPDNRSKAEIIEQFLQEARQLLHREKVYVSADVFGLTTTVADDMGIGQEWDRIARSTDFISPMVYPSHYSKGMYGIAHPNQQPYAVVKRAIHDGMEKNKRLETDGATPVASIRPWLQSFTAGWIQPLHTYQTDEIYMQIKAAEEQGIDSYLLWNPECRYPRI